MRDTSCCSFRLMPVLLLALIFLLAGANNARADLNDDLVGYWSFDEGSGGTAYDYSGNGHNGTIYGATWIEGVAGSALNFDGIDDYVNTWTDFSWSSNESFSLCLWVRPASFSTPHGIFGKGEAGGYGNANWEWNFDTNQDGALRFIYYFGASVGIRLISRLAVDQWDFLTVTYDPVAKAKLYKNGEFVQEFTDINSPFGDRNTPVLIGHSYFSQYMNYYFEGAIDEVRIYNRDLDPDEIYDLYRYVAWLGKPDQRPDNSEGDQSDVSGTSNDPVNTATGSFFHQHTDLSITGRGSPLIFKRYYNSNSQMASPSRNQQSLNKPNAARADNNVSESPDEQPNSMESELKKVEEDK